MLKEIHIKLELFRCDVNSGEKWKNFSFPTTMFDVCKIIKTSITVSYSKFEPRLI